MYCVGLAKRDTSVDAGNRKLNFNRWVGEGGKIVLTGVGGWIDGVTENKTHNGVEGAKTTYVTAADIELNNSGNTTAFTVTDGSSNKFYEFSGTITGSGNMNIDRSIPMNFVFSGDISGWKDGASIGIKNGTQNLYFTEDSTAINLAKIETTAGNSTVTFYHTEATTVASDITKSGAGTLKVSVYNSHANGATFNGALTVDTLTVESNSAATFNGTIVSGRIDVGADGSATFNKEIKTGVLNIASGADASIANHWQYVDAAGSQALPVLQGAGNLTIQAAPDATADETGKTQTRFTVGDYTGRLSIVDSDNLAAYITVAEDKTLRLNGTHSVTQTLLDINLKDGASVMTDLTGELYTTTVSKLRVYGDTKFGTGGEMSGNYKGYQGVFNINVLTSVADDDIKDSITFSSDSNTSKYTVFNIGRMEFWGRLTVESANSSGNRCAVLNLVPVSEEESIGAAWETYSTEFELKTTNSTEDKAVLALGRDSVVKGILGDDTSGYIIAGNLEDCDEIQSNINEGNTGGEEKFVTLTLCTSNLNQGEGNYTSSATIMSNINLVKTTAGSQTFNGDTSAFNGTVDVQYGTLAFGESDLSTKGTTVSEGELKYGNGALTMTRRASDEEMDEAFTEGKTLAAEVTNAEFRVEDDGSLFLDGDTMKYSLIDLKDATALRLGDMHMYDNSQVAGSAVENINKVTLANTTLVMEHLGEGSTETLTADTMSVDTMTALELEIGDEGFFYTTDMFKDVELTGTGIMDIGTLLADALLQHDYVAIEFDTSMLDQNFTLVTGIENDARLQGMPIASYIDGERVYWAVVPEPTTATLSMLALAALAARRRRRK